MKALLALGLLVAAAPVRVAFSADCPPLFYQSEPRDSDWFYASGRGPDASAAREDALRRLAVKATGTEAAASDGTLAGWEQDDHGQCNGVAYALVRIEQERVRRNLSAKKPATPQAQPQPAATGPKVVSTTNNIDNRVSNVTVVAPERKNHTLLILFFAFLLACLALAYRPLSPARISNGPPPDRASVPLDFTAAPPAPRRAAPAPARPVTGRWLKTRFQRAVRQPQKPASEDLVHLGAQYFKAHKGEGTCRAVVGSADLVLAGIREFLSSEYYSKWTVAAGDDSVVALMPDPHWYRGVAFFLYGSDAAASTDCEVLYVENEPAKDQSELTSQEQSIAQGLGAYVQIAAGKIGASHSR